MHLTFPPEMKVSTDITNCRELDGQLVILTCTSNLKLNRIEITFGRRGGVFTNAIDLDGTTTPVYLLGFEKAVNLPTTIATTADITFSTQAGEVRSTTFTSVMGEMAKVNLNPAS